MTEKNGNKLRLCLRVYKINVILQNIFWKIAQYFYFRKQQIQNYSSTYIMNDANKLTNLYLKMRTISLYICTVHIEKR